MYCTTAMRWTPSLPLASAAPRRQPRRASFQLMASQWKPTTTACHLSVVIGPEVHTRVARTF